MRILFYARKPVACRALEHMLDLGHDIVGVITSKPEDPDLHADRLCDYAIKQDIPLLSDQDIYDAIESPATLPNVDLSHIDVVLSMFHQRQIKRPALELPRIGAINIHPAPLPEYQGWGVYNHAIVENISYWGVSAHYMDEGFDTGPIILQHRFDVDMSKETALSLEQRTQPVISEVVEDLFNALAKGKPEGTPQPNGRYISKEMFTELRRINKSDSPEMIDRKIRAFWYPPHPGAQIDITGKQYTLIDNSQLQEIADHFFPERNRSS